MAGHDVGELVATKLQAPTVPTHLVRRARLDDLLDLAIDERHRLVLVSAPAGSGKSTLLAGSLADRDVDLAWLQVEDSDADPVRFWRYLVAAIDRTRPGLNDTVAPTIVSSGGAPDAVVPVLVNALAAGTEPAGRRDRRLSPDRQPRRPRRRRAARRAAAPTTSAS